jgi:hypothetical protein
MAGAKRNNLFCARGIIYDPLAAGESSGTNAAKNQQLFNGIGLASGGESGREGLNAGA